jgi:hypothetical protein
VNRSRSGILTLARAVEAYFAAYNVAAKTLVGLKARSLWSEPRVVIIPGTFDGSDAPRSMSGGQMLAPVQKASHDPREISAWKCELTLSVYALDRTCPQDEVRQIAALEDLLELAQQAVWNGIDPVSGTTPGAAGIEWGKTIWPTVPIIGAAGKEILLQLTMMIPFFDQTPERATPGFTLGRQLMSTAQSGAQASVASANGALATITGLAFCSATQLGEQLVLSGAASAGNNGRFPIVQVLGPTSLVVQNPGAVAGDANNGAIAWQVAPA